MRLLIIGDSWEANWNVKHNNYIGWPNLLVNQFDVTNIAQAGVSQYKICKQLESVNLDDYEFVIFGITSPFRIYTPNHPVHNKDKLHSNSDLIYTDLEYHLRDNPTDNLKSTINFFHNHFDIEYAEFIHKLLIDWALSKLDKTKTIISSNIQNTKNFITNDFIFLDGYELSGSYPGLINHTSEEGNQIFAKEMIKLINEKVDK